MTLQPIPYEFPCMRKISYSFYQSSAAFHTDGLQVMSPCEAITNLHFCRLSLQNLLLVWAVRYSDYDVFFMMGFTGIQVKKVILRHFCKTRFFSILSCFLRIGQPLRTTALCRLHWRLVHQIQDLLLFNIACPGSWFCWPHYDIQT